MYLMRIGAAGAEKPVVRVDDEHYVDVSDVVADFDEAFFAAGAGPVGADRGGAGRRRRTGTRSADVRIGAPIARPHQILCIGLNYSDHAAETGQAVPDEPILFTKSPNTLIGPNDDVRIPRGSTKPDWEVELGIVIGTRASYLTTSRAARAAIAGYVLVNDVSERAFQTERGGQWSKGKSAETFNPAGPWLVTPDEIADVLDLDMWLDVNGVRRQTGSTSTMVFNPYFIVHYLSQFLVLEPGDLINTGTPPGRRAWGTKPPVWLARPGTSWSWPSTGSAASARPSVGAHGDAGASSSPRRAPARCWTCPPRSPRRARWWSTSSGSGSAAPTSSSSPARWPTCTRATRSYPMRLGHEWCGVVTRSAPASTRRWLGRRVTGDTMLGCGHCDRCRAGRHNVCADRFEIGIRGGLPGRAGRAAGRAGVGAARACPTRSTTRPARWSSPAATRCARCGPPA